MLLSEYFHECSEACKEVGAYLLGYQRLIFPYFALHDHIHSENVLKNYQAILSGIYPSLSPAVYALVTCSSYLHDVGMSLPLSRINELRINIQEIESDAPVMREKLASFKEFIRGGLVVLPEEYDENRSASLPNNIADLIRHIHPWVSAKFVASDLGFKRILLEEVSCPETSRCADLRESFLWTLSRLVKLHSSKVNLERQEREVEVGDYRVELVKLAARREASTKDIWWQYIGYLDVVGPPGGLRQFKRIKIKTRAL